MCLTVELKDLHGTLVGVAVLGPVEESTLCQYFQNFLELGRMAEVAKAKRGAKSSLLGTVSGGSA